MNLHLASRILFFLVLELAAATAGGWVRLVFVRMVAA